MGKVIDFTKFMDRDALRRVEKRVNLPSKYSVRLEVTDGEGKGEHCLHYSVSNKKVGDTIAGREMLMDHLLGIIMGICYEDPALIVELQESLEHYFREEEDD